MKARWQQPTQNTDGTAFDASQLAGFELQLDAAAAVSVPRAWSADGWHELDIATLAPAPGKHTLRVLTVAKNGEKSDYTPAVEFTYVRVPRGPFGLSVS